ncbi:hypothetical protein OROMI_029718 [Orobanche minor]
MALGYLGSVTGNGGVELKGRDYFNNLAMRSLFQDFEERDGSIVRCKMHDIVHDFALFLRGNSDRLHDGGCQDCSSLLVSQVQNFRCLVWGVDSLKNVRMIRSSPILGPHRSNSLADLVLLMPFSISACYLFILLHLRNGFFHSLTSS